MYMCPKFERNLGNYQFVNPFEPSASLISATGKQATAVCRTSGAQLIMAAPTLEAIRYSRGKLQLLDQLKLPTETVFMDVPDCDVCWTAIKDMNVRGAPAIAIAAALALAVELDGAKATLATAGDVCAFVATKMDHLNTSRPTAVNLGEAVERIKKLAASLDGSGADAVEAVIAECEGMLAADIANNRAIGSFGADALCAAVGKPAGGGRVSGNEQVQALNRSPMWDLPTSRWSDCSSSGASSGAASASTSNRCHAPSTSRKSR